MSSSFDPERSLLDFFKSNNSEQTFYILKGLYEIYKSKGYTEFLKDITGLINLVAKYETMLSISSNTKGNLKKIKDMLERLNIDVKELERLSKSIASDLINNINDVCISIQGYYNDKKLPMVFKYSCHEMLPDPYNADHNYPARLKYFLTTVLRMRNSYESTVRFSTDLIDYYSKKLGYDISNIKDFSEKLRFVTNSLLDPSFISTLQGITKVLMDSTEYLCVISYYLTPQKIRGKKPSTIIEYEPLIDNIIKYSSYFLRFIFEKTDRFLNFIPSAGLNLTELRNIANQMLEILSKINLNVLESYLTNQGELKLSQIYTGDLLFFTFFNLADALNIYDDYIYKIRNAVLSVPLENRIAITRSILGLKDVEDINMSCRDVHNFILNMNEISNEIYSGGNIAELIDSLRKYVFIRDSINYAFKDVALLMQNVLYSKEITYLSMSLHVENYIHNTSAIELLDRIRIDYNDYNRLINNLHEFRDWINVLKKLDLDQKLSESLVKVVSGDPPTNSKMSLDEVIGKIIKREQANVEEVKGTGIYEFRTDNRVIRAMPVIYDMWKEIGDDGIEYSHLVNWLSKRLDIDDDRKVNEIAIKYLNASYYAGLIKLEEKPTTKPPDTEQTRKREITINAIGIPTGARWKFILARENKYLNFDTNESSIRIKAQEKDNLTFYDVTIGNVIYVPYPRTYTIRSSDLSKGVLDVKYNVSSPQSSQRTGKTNVQTNVKISKPKGTATAGVILSIVYIIELIVIASGFQYSNILFEALTVMDIFFQLAIMGLLVSAVTNPYNSHKKGSYIIIISIIMFFFSIPIIEYVIFFIIFDIAVGISLARFKRR
ncbi:hypothetical protein [Saccharolobus solfataricus]|uniref:Uncharacterized protein n=2 Tax=Saccharolobus solfataricus TaxID=2287 RepID=Q97YE7_SACS2|nr:hypothetical protein [Saccharolobus solfataricus]AAK41613.1 Hypothetical protein SSO1379 [Saccharolobus solfataricus P2]